MNFLKHKLAICLLLVASYMLLPNFAHAQIDIPAPKASNPYDSKNFTPTAARESGGTEGLKAEAKAEIEKAKAEIKKMEQDGSEYNLAKKALEDASKTAGKGAGVLFGGGIIKQAERAAAGKDNVLDKDMKEVKDKIEEFQKKMADTSNASKKEEYKKKIEELEKMQDTVTAFIAQHQLYLTQEDQIEKWENVADSNAELYFMVVGTPPNEEKVYFEKKDGVYVALSGASEGCTPLPAVLAEATECTFCPLFTVLFNAANNMATMSFSSLSGPIAQALLVACAIIIAFKVMLLVSGFTKQDGPKFITELLTQVFKVMVSIVLLSKASFVYDYAISPLLEAGLEFGSAFLFEQGKTAMGQCMEIYGNATTIGDKPISDGVLPRALYLKLHCFILSVQLEIAKPQAIGSTLMCISTNAAASNFIVKNIIPDFGMMMQGFIIWGFSLLVSLAFAFYLIDATVRIGIIGALMPFFIATWPFKITSKYSSTGFSMLMNTFFVYTFSGIVISVNIQLMGSSLGGEGGFAALENEINGQNVKALQKLLDIGMSGMLILIGCCLFGFKLTGQSSQLADSLAGGGGGDIGAKIGGLAASGAKGLAIGGAKAAGGAAVKAGEATGVNAKLRQGKDKVTGSIGRAFGVGRNSGAAGGGKKGGESGGAGGGSKNSGGNANQGGESQGGGQAGNTNQDAGNQGGGNQGGGAQAGNTNQDTGVKNSGNQGGGDATNANADRNNNQNGS